MPVVIFNPTLFKVRYPEFAAVSDDLLTAFFAEAGIYLNNTDCSIVQDIARRTVFLNMLTAHIASLSGATTSDGQPKPVGRLSDASEGSVSARFDYTPATPGSGAWFNQTPYGAAFWQGTSYLRSAVYIPQPTRWR